MPTRPSSARVSVDLPQPLSPTSPTLSPASTRKLDAVDGAKALARAEQAARPARVADDEIVDGEQLAAGRAARRRVGCPRGRGDQGSRVGGTGRREDGVEGSGVDDVPVLHDDQVVGHVGDDREVVGDQHEREPVLPLEPSEQHEDLRLRRHVERRRRLVGDQELRAAGDRDRDDDALALPAGELVRVARGRDRPVVETGPLERRGGEPLGLRRAHPTNAGFRRRVGRAGTAGRTGARAGARNGSSGALPAHAVQPDALGHLRTDRLQRVQRRHRLLEHHADLAAAHRLQRALVEACQLAPVEADRTGESRPARQQAHRRERRHRLPGAALADDAERVPFPHLEIESVQDRCAADRDVDAVKREHRLRDRLGDLVRRTPLALRHRPSRHQLVSQLIIYI